MYRLAFFGCFLAGVTAFLTISCNQKTITSHTGHKANKLINESSPYLLQHAYNPVDWHPWGQDALDKAEAENKLLIISIGYAACHWCHVMEHESFEDSLVAEVMNNNFLPIKVDREERPDVDDVYMTAAQLINKRGGWPLNAIALPNGQPIFAGTYYPKDQWLKILQNFVELQASEPEKLVKYAQELTDGIASTTLINVNENPLNFSMEDMDALVVRGLQKYDKKYGGRLGAPKFPMPNSYEFLMKYHWLTGNKDALATTTLALDKMAEGGLYDQIGGGFTRYSTDEFWLAPHFEKMLYDNGQMISIYAQAYKLTKKPLYKKIISQSIEFAERELSNKKGGFYASLDADSEGEEGKFYVWSKAELDSIINNETHSKVFNMYYDVSKGGNWEHHNILNVVRGLKEVADKTKQTEAQVQSILAACNSKVMAARDHRIRPGTDDKTLTSWNALMMAGLVDTYDALGDRKYLDLAVANANFLIKNQMDKDGRLDRSYKDGKSSINAFLDDYALLIHGLVKLYQVSFDPAWLEKSELLAAYTIKHFYNEESKMFNYTSDLDPPLIAKKAEYNDNVIPASNSSMARSLHALGTLTYNTKYLDMSKQMLNNMMPKVSTTEYLSFRSNWLQLLLDHIKAPYEIAIVGDNAMERRAELSKHYLGNSILLGSTKEENLELLESKYQEGATMIYVCQNKTCKKPTEEVEKALGLAVHR